jgi:hypothetical protein
VASATLLCRAGQLAALVFMRALARAQGRVSEMADTYYVAWIARNPEVATFQGLPGAEHGRLTDNSPGALAAWQRREDDW